MKKLVKLAALLLCLACVVTAFAGCADKKEKVIIYTSAEKFRVADLDARLREEFPEYDVVIEYLSTGNHAAKLLSEGKKTECDITYDLEYGYLAQLDEKGYLTDLSKYDTSIFTSDVVVSKNYMPELRNGGAIILNTALLKSKNLAEPTSYADLLKPEYKGLVSMPNPKASGTGYMFLKNLVNAWGEEKALEYFDELTPNILQYTSSGSGPVNALLQGEAAIGFGMTAQAVLNINEGADFKIVFFEEGSPYSLYGQSIISGKEEKESVRRVFDFLINTYGKETNDKFYPEQIYKNHIPHIENYPQNIVYGDMSNNTSAEKTRILDKWKY